jgi:hypothetical protein
LALAINQDIMKIFRIAITGAAGFLLCNCASLNGGGISRLDADADAALRAMSDKLSAAEQLSFEVSRKIDPSLVPGGKVGLNARIKGAAMRPNKLAATSTANGVTRRFYYDGESVTLQNVEMNHYATVPGARSIDKTIDKIAERWDFNPPMADLLVSDPYHSLTRTVSGGKLADGGSVGGEACKRISATGETVDWDLWLAKSDDLPRKFVITVKGRPGSPQVELRIRNWDLAPKLDAGQFTFTPPKGAQEIEMAASGSN